MEAWTEPKEQREHTIPSLHCVIIEWRKTSGSRAFFTFNLTQRRGEWKKDKEKRRAFLTLFTLFFLHSSFMVLFPLVHLNYKRSAWIKCEQRRTKNPRTEWRAQKNKGKWKACTRSSLTLSFTIPLLLLCALFKYKRKGM